MALKDYYDGECARILGELVRAQAHEFDVEGYVADTNTRVGPLELKDRVLVLAEGLRDRLDPDYETAVDTLVRALPEEIGDGEGMFNEGWALSPVARFVEEFGLEHPEVSLRAIEEITKRHTGEFAIRPYLREHHELTMRAVHHWASSPNPHVRRLASEGVRTRLPWAARFAPFQADPTPLISVITPLITDPSRYVRTSVANNLNDISKDNPEIALKTARDWLAQSASPDTLWIVTKGLRTLVKQGNPEALAILGAEADPSIAVRQLRLTPTELTLGNTAVIEAEITNDSDEQRRVIVDYRMYLLKKNGLRKPTTFKLKTVTLSPGETVTARKRHTFRPVTTRVYYPGTQAVTITANGAESEPVEFELSLGS